MSSSTTLPRRSFLAGLGLTFTTLAVGLPPLRAEASLTPLPQGGLTPSVFIHVAPDGLVTIVCHRSEMASGKSSMPCWSSPTSAWVTPGLKVDEMGGNAARWSQAVTLPSAPSPATSRCALVLWK